MIVNVYPNKDPDKNSKRIKRALSRLANTHDGHGILQIHGYIRVAEPIVNEAYGVTIAGAGYADIHRVGTSHTGWGLITKGPLRNLRFQSSAGDGIWQDHVRYTVGMHNVRTWGGNIGIKQTRCWFCTLSNVIIASSKQIAYWGLQCNRSRLEQISINSGQGIFRLENSGWTTIDGINMEGVAPENRACIEIRNSLSTRILTPAFEGCVHNNYPLFELFAANSAYSKIMQIQNLSMSAQSRPSCAVLAHDHSQLVIDSPNTGYFDQDNQYFVILDGGQHVEPVLTNLRLKGCPPERHVVVSGAQII